MASRLSVTSVLNRPYLSASRYEDDAIYALIEITPQVTLQTRQRAALNLAVVVDSSATMHNFQLSPEEREYWMSLALSRDEMERGQADEREAVYWSGQTLEEMQGAVRKPMTMAVSAIKELLSRLQYGDKVSVVAFADLPTTLITDRQWQDTPQECEEQLDALLDQRLPVDIGAGTRMSQALLQARDLVKASQSQGSVNRIIVLSDGIVQDDRDTMLAIDQIMSDNYPVTTIGVGDEFDEEFLMRLSDNSRGAYYYAADIMEITDSLMQELTVIQSTAVQQLYVSAVGISGASIQEIYMVRPRMTIFEEVEVDGGMVKAHVGDLAADIETGLLVQIMPSTGNAGKRPLAQLQLSWKDAGGLDDDPMQALEMKVDAEFTDDPALLKQVNPDVQDLVDRFNIYRFEREAQHAQEKGDIAKAKEKLGAATRELVKLGETALARDLEAQIASLGKDQDPALSKRIKATTRRLGEKSTPTGAL
jgi:Ca-activated chloride channel family protein